MPLNNAEQVLTSKHLKAAAPLDRKKKYATLAERDAIASGDRYPMMRVSVDETELDYKLDKTDLTNTGWKVAHDTDTDTVYDDSDVLKDSDALTAVTPSNKLLTEADDSGIPDAPSDGNTYGRKDAAWIAIAIGGGIPDAPSDGTPYSRQDAAWVNAAIANTAANFELLISDGAGGYRHSANVKAFESFGRVQLTNVDDRTCNYDANGMHVSNLAGNSSLIELYVEDDSKVGFSLGDFNSPSMWLSTSTSQAGFSNSWFNFGHPFGIGTNSPQSGLTLDVAGTGGMTIPIGTEAQRATPLGHVRFNNDSQRPEIMGSLFNNNGGFQNLGENKRDSIIEQEGILTASSTVSSSYNLGFLSSEDGTVELRIKFIAYDTLNGLSHSGEYIAIYSIVGITATLIGTQQTIFEVTDDVGNPIIVTLGINASNANISIATTNILTPARDYNFYYEGTFRLNRVKATIV